MMETLPVLFVVTSLILILTPGQDMLLVMSRSISQGSKAGVATAAGVSTGLLGHTALATLGLGAVLSASELLFVAIKLVGAAYLIYLGIRLLLSRQSDLDTEKLSQTSLKKMFLQGAISNISNPKITIFYFAYLPQFVPAGEVNPTLRLLLLGASFAVLTFIVKGPIGYGAGILSGWLRARPKVIGWTHRLSGLVLIGLGLRLALARRS